jgi:menaquinone-dependent protoporphyrinogen oxidase
VHVLVAVASKHGATRSYATTIADTLQRRGYDITLTDDPDSVRDVTPFDAVVLGSAIYAGRWQPSAKSFASRLREDLERRPTWLFSSGPVGDPPLPAEDPVDAAEVVAITGAREHRIFPGQVEVQRLGRGERMIVKLLRVPERDDRDLSGAEAWAEHLADTLAESVGPARS